jgi:hypothetical protein
MEPAGGPDVWLSGIITLHQSEALRPNCGILAGPSGHDLSASLPTICEAWHEYNLPTLYRGQVTT